MVTVPWERKSEAARSRSGFEAYSWLFMRASAVLLLLLVLGHFAIMHLVAGVDQVNYAFVATRFSTPFWRAYDLLTLFLGLLHGLNGTRAVLDDYLRSRPWRTFWFSVLYTAGLVLLLVGGLVILTFQPQT